MYTVESHIRYLAETKQGDVIEAASLLVSADAQRMRVHTLLRRDDGYRSPPENTSTCTSTRRPAK